MKTLWVKEKMLVDSIFSFSHNALPQRPVPQSCENQGLFWKELTEKLKFVLNSVGKKIVGKEENAGYQHFLLFTQWFYTRYNEVEGGILELPWLSVRLSVHPPVRGHNFVQSFSPTVLHVLLWNLYIMFVYIWSCACAVFMPILSYHWLWNYFPLYL